MATAGHCGWNGNSTTRRSGFGPLSPERTTFATGCRTRPTATSTRLARCPCHRLKAGQAADGPAEPGRVLTAEPPRLLVLFWGDHQLRFELIPTAGGVRLVLVHTFDEPNEAPDCGAGWHLCLSALTSRLDGQDVPRSPGRPPATTAGTTFARSAPECSRPRGRPHPAAGDAVRPPGPLK